MNRHPRRPGRLVYPVLGALTSLVAACDLAYPEVVVVNETAAAVLLKDLSFSGCAWSTVLDFGESTSPQRCLPGEDRVHFQKLDMGSVNTRSDAAPTWFRYETVTPRQAAYGDFQRFEIRLDDLEQDFSVPGPYGH